MHFQLKPNSKDGKECIWDVDPDKQSIFIHFVSKSDEK